MKLENLHLSTDMMDSYQISAFVRHQFDIEDHTSFEVYPTMNDILSGTIDQYTGLVYSADVPKENVFYLYIVGTKPYGESDVIIDFGDGSVVFDLNKNTVDESEDTDGLKYSGKDNDMVIKHTYGAQGRFIVRIFGRDYYQLRGYNYNGKYKKGHRLNLVSRFLDSDLKISSNLKNVSSFLSEQIVTGNGLQNEGSRRIQRVVDDSQRQCEALVNIAGLFGRCENLLSVRLSDGFIRYKRKNTEQLFMDCKNLKWTNYSLIHPQYSDNSFFGIYRGCENLEMDISSLISKEMTGDEIIFNTTFTSCKKIYGTVPGDLLWNNPYRKVTNKGTVFNGCELSIRQQCPSAWASEGRVKKINPSFQDLTYEVERLSSQCETLLKENLVLKEKSKGQYNTFELTDGSILTKSKFDFDYHERKFSYDGDRLSVRNVYELANNFTILSDLSFYGAKKLLGVSSDYILEVGLSSFYGDGNIQMVSFPNATVLKQYSFYGCNSISYVYLPSVRDLKDRVFTSLTQLKQIDLPNLSSMQEYAFNNCTVMSSMNLPNVVRMDTNSLYNSTKLKYLNIPQVSSLNNVFNGITGNLSIDFSDRTSDTIPELKDSGIFGSLGSGYRIIVPESSYGRWTSAEGWKDVSSHMMITR